VVGQRLQAGPLPSWRFDHEPDARSLFVLVLFQPDGFRRQQLAEPRSEADNRYVSVAST